MQRWWHVPGGGTPFDRMCIVPIAVGSMPVVTDERDECKPGTKRTRCRSARPAPQAGRDWGAGVLGARPDSTVVMYQIEGLIHPQPDDLDPTDDYYWRDVRAGVLEHVAIDDLVDDASETEYNEPDDETLSGLKKIRKTLERCMVRS